MFDELYETKPEAPTATEVATTKPSDVALEDIDLQKIALAHFDRSNEALQLARVKLTDVVLDLSTAGKLAEAKSLRERLINAPLAEARKVNKGLKAKLTVVSKAVGARLESIEAGFADAEKLITPQIEARDAEIAAEKAERERIESERVASHRANLAKIAGYVGQAQGKTSEQLVTMINGVAAIVIDPVAWEEFAVGAEIQKTETLEALQDLFDRTKSAEDEAADREAQRIENERLAAELAERERALAEKQAEIDRKLAEIAAAEKIEADRIEAAVQAHAAEQQRILESRDRFLAAEVAKAEEDRKHSFSFAKAAEDEASVKAQETAADALQFALDTTPPEIIDDAYTGRMAVSTGVLHPAPEPAQAADMDEVAAKPWMLATGPITFAQPELAATDEEPTLALGAINARFGAGFTMTAAFVTDILGIAPAGTKKAAVLFRPSQFAEICDALVEHIGVVCESVAA